MIILGSQSERRKTILNFFTLPFEQIPSNFDETTISYKGDPKEYVCKIAEEKAKKLCKHYPDQIILTADTIVYGKNKIYTKPESEEQAMQMLEDFCGNSQSVFTGVCVGKNRELQIDAEETKVHFHPLTKKEILAYHKAFHKKGLAGGFAVQDAGSIIIKKIEGCFYNVLGLPITTSKNLLIKFGIDLWNFLPS